MKTVTSVLFLAALAAGGCVHRRVTVVSHDDPAPVYDDGGYVEDEVYVEDDPYFEDDFEAYDPVWDGHAFIVIDNHYHGDGCGHYFHHGYWHLFPEHHVYVEVGYSHCGDHGDFVRAGVRWTRVWDGCRFVMLCRHVHGPGCGHYFHSGCWHVHPHHYVYESHRSRHFEKSCEVASAPRRRHGSYEKGQAYREGPREVRQSQARQPASSPDPRRGAYSVREPEVRQDSGRARGQAKQRGGQPGAAGEARGWEKPMTREPRRAEPAQGEAQRGPEKRSSQEKSYRRDGQAERSSRESEKRFRQDVPNRVESPKEAPRRFERPQKQEAPRQGEPPRRIERVQKQEAPRRAEAPRGAQRPQEPPKQQKQGKQEKTKEPKK